jgi:hypothetical protein
MITSRYGSEMCSMTSRLMYLEYHVLIFLVFVDVSDSMKSRLGIYQLGIFESQLNIAE